MDEVAERLNTGNRAGENVVASEHEPKYFHDRPPRCAGESAQETPFEPEKDAQSLRDRPDDLPMGDWLADTLRNPLGQQKRPLLMTTGTKTPLLTREGHEHLMRTIGALDSGESEVEVAEAEKLADHLTDDGPPASVAPLVTLTIGAFELGIVAIDKPVQWRLPRLSVTVREIRKGPDPVSPNGRHPSFRHNNTRPGQVYPSGVRRSWKNST